MRRCVCLLFCFVVAPLWAQNNVFDLRPAEFNEDGKVTYQNFIYSRYLADGKIFLNAVHIRIPPDDYREFALGAGYNAVTVHGFRGYIAGNVSLASDDTYFEPAILTVGGNNRLYGFLYLTYYVPLGGKGINQWLLDPFELQYTITGPLAVGFSSYYYKPEGAPSSNKIGGKLSYAYRYGSFDLAIRQVNMDRGIEFQFRTLVVF
ncbi:hypothetical protein JXO59_11320 [candidate division KSB1 bacterium]|nr:hypothetical protein [candidate division KSB1 bacterium]